MTDEILNFREARALKANDSKLWTPLDCLKALVRDLESGEMKPVDALYVAMVRKNNDEQAQSFPFYAAGTTTLEYRAILTQHIHEMCAAFDASRRSS